MGQGKGIREVGYIDCVGGGQVVVKGGVAYIGSMRAPGGTLIVDVSDPKHPRELSRLEVGVGTHSHKVRVEGDLMVVNREINPFQPGASADFKGGLGIYDVSTPAKPKLISQWETEGMGVHRFDFDGRYAYISPTVKGYVGNIMMILDLADPAKPAEVGRWWMPGQWTGGGETPTWKGTDFRCHHPLRLGNRLYTSYWHGGFVILDIDDLSKPKLVSSFNTGPAFPWPTHTCLTLPYPIQNRRIMLLASEDAGRSRDFYPAFLWVYDITDEKQPLPFASYQVEGIDGTPQPEFTGVHQPSEVIMGTEIPIAWFAYGLRVLEFSNPHAPREVAWYLPDPAPDAQAKGRAQSNDVTIDSRGLIYLLDRIRGCHILERV
ncbi:MAG: LVIVD repeat-containing protein [Acidobacteriota bacterium]